MIVWPIRKTLIVRKLCLVLSLGLFSTVTAFAAPVLRDPNLVVTDVVSGLSLPTTLAFIGPGDFLVLQKNNGQVRRVIGGVLQPTPVLDVHVDSLSERGLLGIAVHPNFPSSPFVYLYLTESSTGTDSSGFADGNHVYRYIWDGAAGTLTSPMLILNLPVFQGPNHDGGIICFGPDQKLYVVIGDLNRNGQLQNNTEPGAALPDDTSVILRVNPDGTTPSDNPFFALGGTVARYYAYGIRNSFGLAFDPLTEVLWMTENGPDLYDEINRVEPGFNSGWRSILGPDERDTSGLGDLVQLPGSHYADPKFSWRATVGPTAIVFLNSLALGAAYQFDAFVGDINNGNLYRLRPNPNRDGFVFNGASLADLVADSSSELDELILGTGFGGITDLKVGTDGRLYVVSIGTGTIYAISALADSAVAPETSITSGPVGTITVDSAIFSWTGTDNNTPAGDLLYASRLDPIETSFSPFGSPKMKTYTNLASGNYIFFVKAKDQAGIEDPTPASRVFSVSAGGVNSIVPNSIDLISPPASFAVAGFGFANFGFGLPVVNFTRNGIMLAAIRASAGTNSSLTIPFPNNQGLSAGMVMAEVYNQTGSNSWSFIASTSLTVNDTRPCASCVSGITPNPIDLATPPASFAITGGGFLDSGFGLSVVNLTRNGIILAAIRSSAGTNSSLTVPFPSNQGLSAGPVTAQVYNQSGPNSWSFIGSTALTVVDARPDPEVSSITPNPIDLAIPPTSFTINGNGFMNFGVGLPVVNFTRNGIILAAARASSGTSSSLTISFPGTNDGAYPGLSAGMVTAEVYNQIGSNSWSFIGSTSLTINDTRPCASCVSGITPNPIDLVAPPASFTIAGGGFVNFGFGLPVVNFTRNGIILAAIRSSPGTNSSLTVPFPTHQGLSAGPVTAQVYNQLGSNSWSLVGSTTLTIIDTRPCASCVSGITPNPIDLVAPPAHITLTGGGFTNSGFGLSVVNFTRSGIILAAIRASAGTSTSLTVPFPSNQGLSAGMVTAQVYNQTGPGSWSFVGSTSLMVLDSNLTQSPVRSPAPS
jgi:glucose/arabinose dehydrogenase